MESASKQGGMSRAAKKRAKKRQKVKQATTNKRPKHIEESEEKKDEPSDTLYEPIDDVVSEDDVVDMKETTECKQFSLPFPMGKFWLSQFPMSPLILSKGKGTFLFWSIMAKRY